MYNAESRAANLGVDFNAKFGRRTENIIAVSYRRLGLYGQPIILEHSVDLYCTCQRGP